MTKRKAQTQPSHPEAASASATPSKQPSVLVKKAGNQKSIKIVQQKDISAADSSLDIDDIFKTARKAIKTPTPTVEVLAVEDPHMAMRI